MSAGADSIEISYSSLDLRRIRQFWGFITLNHLSIRKAPKVIFKARIGAQMETPCVRMKRYRLRGCIRIIESAAPVSLATKRSERPTER